MEDLMYLVLALLLGIMYEVIMKENKIREVSINTSEIIIPVFEKSTSNADKIKEQLIRIYDSDNISNKREKIVSLLMHLERVEDTDIFFEEYDYIRSFIFTPT